MLSMVAGRAKATTARTILALPLKYKTAVTAHKGAMTRKLKRRRNVTSCQESHLLHMNDQQDRSKASAKKRQPRHPSATSLCSSGVFAIRCTECSDRSIIRLRSFRSYENPCRHSGRRLSSADNIRHCTPSRPAQQQSHLRPCRRSQSRVLYRYIGSPAPQMPAECNGELPDRQDYSVNRPIPGPSGIPAARVVR